MGAHSRISWHALRLILGVGLVPCFAACVLPISLAGNVPSALKAVFPTMTMNVGEEKDLLPLIRILNTDTVPFVPLTWAVSNPALLSVDPVTGRAKALAVGSVVVQVKAGNDQAGATQIIVEIVGEGSGVVKAVHVVPGSHKMAVGESVTLRAHVFMPDGQIHGNVVWSSSDNTIATVNQSNGAVTALKPGRVTIVAAYALGPTFKGIADISVYPTRAEIPTAPSIPS